MRLFGRCNLAANVEEMAWDARGNAQLCADLQAGIEGNLHADVVRPIWPDSDGWTFDKGVGDEDVFEQLVDAAGHEIAMQQQQALHPEQGSEDAVGPGRTADTTNDYYEPNTWPWCNHRSRFAFNCYPHHDSVYVRNHPGDPPIIITSQEGVAVAQGDVFGGFLYGVGLVPLAEQMREEIPTVLQTWFSDDMAGAGTAAHNAECLNFLMKKGPSYGYFHEPEKSWYICKGEDDADARAAFNSFGINIHYTWGHRYLGGFIGSAKTKSEWMNSMVEVWSEAVSVPCQKWQ
ncbi:hypothetical protein ACHAXR_008166 [Thalassiosira sp. AJA248-18]